MPQNITPTPEYIKMVNLLRSRGMDEAKVKTMLGFWHLMSSPMPFDDEYLYCLIDDWLACD